VERRYLISLIDRYGGNRAKAAAAVGISERTLYRKIKNSSASASGQD
jgi:DNA-binding NtrC family response regulator